MVTYPMEIQDQMNYFALKIGSQLLNCVLTFDGQLDAQLLKEAIRRSIEIEKILGCRLVQSNNLVYWKSRDDSAHLVPCEIVESANTQKDMENFWIQEIDLENGPLIQVKLLRSDKDCLCIKISHVICDAGGLKNYVVLLSKLYSELADGKAIPDKYQSVDIRGQAQILQNLQPSVSAILNEKSRSFFTSVQPHWSFPSNGYQKSKLRYSILKIDKALFHAIMNTTKEKMVTLNDMLLTAFCCALRKEEHYPLNKPFLIQIPVDLRRYLVNNNICRICNLSGTEYLNIAIENNDFTDVLKKINDYMQTTKSNCPGLTSSFAMEFLKNAPFEQAMSMAHSSMEKSKQYNLSIPILSNMGIIPDNCKHFGKLTAIGAYLISPVMYSPGFMLGFSSFGDTLTFTIGFCEDSIHIEHIQKFQKRIVTELEDACAYT